MEWATGLDGSLCKKESGLSKFCNRKYSIEQIDLISFVIILKIRLLQNSKPSNFSKKMYKIFWVESQIIHVRFSKKLKT